MIHTLTAFHIIRILITIICSNHLPSHKTHTHKLLIDTHAHTSIHPISLSPRSQINGNNKDKFDTPFHLRFHTDAKARATEAKTGKSERGDAGDLSFHTTTITLPLLLLLLLLLLLVRLALVSGPTK
jgi:hypothetical protein